MGSGMATAHDVRSDLQPTQEPEPERVLRTPGPTVRGNQDAQDALDPEAPFGADDRHALVRVDHAVDGWADAVGDRDLTEAELALAGLGVALRWAPTGPPAEPTLTRALGVVGGTGSPTADNVLHHADRGVERLRYQERRSQALHVDGAGPSAQAGAAALGLSLDDQVAALHRALREGDAQTVQNLLAGDNRALSLAYAQQHGRSVAAAIAANPPGGRLWPLLDFAEQGHQDVVTRFLDHTAHVLGTDEDGLWTLLETASHDQRRQLAQDPRVAAAVAQDLGPAERARVERVLGPFQAPDGGDSAAIAVQEARLDHQAGSLRIRLEARKGLFDDDEAGMVADVQAWALARGEAFPQVAEGDPPELASVVAFLRSELGREDLAQALTLLKTGGQPGLVDRIELAASATTLWVPDTDEEAIYAALRSASPAERAALRDDPQARSRALAHLDPDEQARAEALLASDFQGAGAVGLDRLLAELDSPLHISDAVVYDALDGLTPQELQAVREDRALRARIEDGVSDVGRVRDVLGHSSGARGPSLQADNARMVARLEEALGHVDDHEDRAYRVVLQWQDAGGALDPRRDYALLARARVALLDLDTLRRIQLEGALDGTCPLTWQARLDSAARGAGTDDAGLLATLAEVPPAVLVLEWSNLPDFAAQARGARAPAELEALADFVPDVAASVRAVIHGERWSDGVDVLADLRGRLQSALADPGIQDRARAAFGYLPTPEDLDRLRYAAAAEVQDHDRSGAANAAGGWIMDGLDPAGPHGERSFAEYHAAADARQREENPVLRGQLAEEEGRKHQAWLEAGADYRQAKAAAAQVAGAVVEIGVGLLMTLATGGFGAGTMTRLLGSFTAAAAGAGTTAAVDGAGADVEAMAEDLTATVFDSLTGPGLEGLAGAIHRGLRGSAAGKAFAAGATAVLGTDLGVRVGEASRTAFTVTLAEFPGGYAKDLARTEGLLRQEALGMPSSLRAAANKASKLALTQAVAPGNPHRDTDIGELEAQGAWSAALAERVEQGRVDAIVLAAVTAIIDEEAPSPADYATVLASWLAAPTTAGADTAGSKANAAAALDYLSSATVPDLRALNGVSGDLARRTCAVRSELPGGRFTTMDEVLSIDGWSQDVLAPAAHALHSTWLRLPLEAP